MTDRTWNDAGSPAAYATNATRGRRALFRGLTLLGLMVATPFVTSGDARAAEDDRTRFSGFLDIAPHVVVQKVKGSVATNFAVEADKSNILTNMTFRLGGGFKTPEFESVWGRPRPVIWAAALVPLNESSTIGTSFIEERNLGIERLEYSKFAVEYETSALAGIGLEFVDPVFDTGISVTAGIESLHLAVRYTGTVTVESQQGANPPIAVSAKKHLTEHFIGPVLRIGSPTFVYEGLVIDFGLDLSVLFDVAGTRRRFPSSTDGTNSAEFTFESGSGVVQIGTGFQVRWP
jgi:hypothetical protein